MALPPASLLAQFTGESSVVTVPGTCDGVWGRSYVRRAVETVLSTSSSDPVWIPGFVPAQNGGTIALRTDPTAATTNFSRVSGSSITGAPKVGSFSFLVRDNNRVRLNPMAAGSTIAVKGTTGLTVAVQGGSPVPSSSDATVVGITFEFGDPPSPQSGLATITVTSPGGLATTFGVNVSR
jgi:hypothetical protein